MGIMITSAFHSEFIYWVDVLLPSSLRSKHHGLGLKERRDFWNLAHVVGGSWKSSSVC